MEGLLISNNAFVPASDCSRCELASLCLHAGNVSKKDFQNVKFMIIGDYPTDTDDAKGELFSSPSGKLVRTILDEVIEAPSDSYYLTNLVKCAPAKGAKINKENADACFDYLLSEILTIKPLVIITLGNFVTEYLIGQEFINSVHGKFFDKTFGTDITHFCKVVPTYSPIYCSYNKDVLKPFAQDIEKAYITALDLTSNAATVPFTYCKTVADVERLCDYIEQAGICVPDFETIGVDTYAEDFYPTLLSISFQLGHSYVIPLFHFESWFTKEEVYHIMGILDARVFQNPSIVKANHNLKYEMHVLNWLGIPSIRGKLDDTMLMHHYLDEDSKHGLKEIIAVQMPEYAGYEDTIKKWAWDKVPLEHLAPYAATDTVLTFALRIKYLRELMADPQSYYSYRNMTIPALVALYEAERQGLKVDATFLESSISEAHRLAEIQNTTLSKFKAVKRFIVHKNEELTLKAVQSLEIKLEETRKKEPKNKRIETSISKLETSIAEIKAGTKIYYDAVNFDAPAQLAGLLYSKEGFGFKQPYSKKHRKPMPLTGKDEVVRLGDKTGFIDEFLLYKVIKKMQGTYLEGMHKLLDKNNYIHTSFLLHGTETGRLASKSPNMQNIPRGAKLDNPIAKDLVGRIKKIFIPSDTGRCLLQLDYAQAELRIAASFADEDIMLQAYRDNLDLHTVTAMSASGLTAEQWVNLSDSEKKEYRRRAKAGNFGLIYGMSVDGFIEYARNNYGVIYTEEGAQKYHRKFFRTYPKLLVWHAGAVMEGQKNGYVRTLFGRKRHLPDINHPNDCIAAEDGRIAVNSPVQGTAGEFTIFALALLRHRLPKEVKLVNTVHDSVLLDLPVTMLQDTMRIAVTTCENLPIKQYFKVELQNVSMKVDAEYSDKSWKDLEPIKLEENNKL